MVASPRSASHRDQADWTGLGLACRRVQPRIGVGRRRPALRRLACYICPSSPLPRPLTPSCRKGDTVLAEQFLDDRVPPKSHRPQALRKHAKCNRQLATGNMQQTARNMQQTARKMQNAICNRQLATCNMQPTGVPFPPYEAKHAAKAQPSTSGLLCTIGRTDMRRAAQCQRTAAHQPASHLMYTSRREACSSRRPNASHAAH